MMQFAACSMKSLHIWQSEMNIVPKLSNFSAVVLDRTMKGRRSVKHSDAAERIVIRDRAIATLSKGCPYVCET